MPEIFRYLPEGYHAENILIVENEILIETICILSKIKRKTCRLLFALDVIAVLSCFYQEHPQQSCRKNI